MTDEEKKAIEIVREFNIKNRYRDMGRINNAIDTVIRMAEEKEKNLYKDNIIKNLGLKTIPKTITEFKKLIELNYISKDKIRAKIKELEKDLEE